MDLEILRSYCLSKSGVTETTPFGPDALVYKVNGKVFALIGLARERLGISLKCDPDYAIELRDEYSDDIIPGYHLNKKHWNTVYTDGGVKSKLIKELIDHSYLLVTPKDKR